MTNKVIGIGCVLASNYMLANFSDVTLSRPNSSSNSQLLGRTATSVLYRGVGVDLPNNTPRVSASAIAVNGSCWCTNELLLHPPQGLTEGGGSRGSGPPPPFLTRRSFANF